ncbi:Integrins alpha chain [Jannaschia sp. CCS1]|nr:Integrins alpha chain [Jannaschia sp. CCS1]
MAPRHPPRALKGCARGVWMGLCLGVASAGAAFGCSAALHLETQMPESVSAAGLNGGLAWYDGPTTRYAHGVLGDAIEGTELHAYTDRASVACGVPSAVLPEELVFEDTAPRLIDLDFDGRPEIIVVQSHQRLGAQLAVYSFADDGVSLRETAATPFIGRSNRWLAPIGAADLNGDGLMEIAYIDRPHLARTLRVWRFEDGALTEIATMEGLTNHRIGEPFITGGIRDCGDGPEMITANQGWSQVMATRFIGDTLDTRGLGAFSPAAISQALACQL